MALLEVAGAGVEMIRGGVGEAVLETGGGCDTGAGVDDGALGADSATGVRAPSGTGGGGFGVEGVLRKLFEAERDLGGGGGIFLAF
jgi:hypothetical protein